MLREELVELVDPTWTGGCRTGAHGQPGVVLVVGVNGTGKTTTVGKIARILVAEDKLGDARRRRHLPRRRRRAAGHLGRACRRRGRPRPEGGDPASVAFDAVKDGTSSGVDIVIIDTAGRLQNKAGLMDELGKVKRVIEKRRPSTRCCSSSTPPRARTA